MSHCLTILVFNRATKAQNNKFVIKYDPCSISEASS